MTGWPPERCPICGVDLVLAQSQPGAVLASRPSCLEPGHLPQRDHLCQLCREVVDVPVAATGPPRWPVA